MTENNEQHFLSSCKKDGLVYSLQKDDKRSIETLYISKNQLDLVMTAT